MRANIHFSSADLFPKCQEHLFGGIQGPEYVGHPSTASSGIELAGG